ncbi:chromatin modification-related protein EAF1 A-like [Silene latifolia]|uniref:chromatin modification-related protein EAF1 A-like n=1 Tax=Silene latifolia TaxID=37657 RepID=UPI003D78A60D
MHGFSSGSTSLINAEPDAMGGVLDGDVGIGTKPSPRRAAIEKAQAELRLEYDIREERKRELEFLEKGGDPLDFKFGHAVSVSVQSTSHTDQQLDQNLTSEAKGSFALTPSPHGDSVESSGRLGVTTTCEPNSADNFDCENEILQSDMKPLCPGRSNIPLLEHFSQLGRGQTVKNLEDCQAYRRRNRSRPNHVDLRSSSADMPSGEGHDSSMPARHGILSKPVASENQIEMEVDGTHVMHPMTSRVTKFAEGKNSSIQKEKLEEVRNMCLKANEALDTVTNVEPSIDVGRDSIVNLDVDCPPFMGAENTEYNAAASHLNETGKVDGDDKRTTTDALNNKVPGVTEGLFSESTSSHTAILNGNGNIDSDLLTKLDNVDSNGALKGQMVSVGEKSVSKDMPSEDHVTNAMEIAPFINEGQSPTSHQGNGSIKQDHAEVDKDKSFLQDEAKGVPCVEGQEKHDSAEIKSEKELGQLDNCGPEVETSCPVRPILDLASDSSVLEILPCTENQSKPLDRAQEDRILEEARMIVAKRKRIAALSIGLFPREHRQKCHWDLVLEEMSWLANDFAQERLWKMTAAAQNCRRVAFASRIRLEERNKFSNQKSVAHTLAKAVLEFWHAARLSVEKADSSQLEKCKHELPLETIDMDNKASSDMMKSTKRKLNHAIYGYAVRFVQCNSLSKPLVEIEVPGVTNVTCDIGLPELSWEDQFSEENLFYAVPPGAMEMYRKSIESCLEEFERIGNSTLEEVVTSTHSAAAECEYEDKDCEENEGENLYYQHGALHTGKPSKKKLKIIKSYAARSYKFGDDFSYGHCAETRNGPTQLTVMGKRPVNNLHVDPIPIKRMRTASRQRVVGPFGTGSVGVAPVLSRADASSEDTNSFQDDQNTPHGGSVGLRGLEVDSTMNYENQSMFDSAEKSAKPKKKKKIKHQSLSHDQRWQLDSTMQNEQNDLVRKRSVNHQPESNGNSSLFGQHAKKPKLAKHSLDKSFDNATLMSGSAASPVASQMSNMSSQNKLIKFIGVRDRGKKGKGLKVSTGQLGSGSPWTIVEDQALVVLVHDMGPNWELVSDAINSILQFKCIFRKPHECKERHKFLMDRPSDDGADSGEDSGSSQPYPSTLPGIPKGSARQLFRSLHAHVEEDNIKSRFEKIILIEQQLFFRKKKNDNQDLKHIAPAHGSHVLSLSQVIPNNLNGGVLTPLDLSDTATSNQENLSADGLGSTPVINSTSGLNSPLQSPQGSQGMSLANNLASPQLTSSRDARYSVPRPIEEQQRLHQFNSMLPGRNVQTPNFSSPGSLSGSDRGVRMHPGGNGVNVMPGINRSVPMARPRVQGIPSTPMLNSSSMTSNVGGMPGNINVHSGTASGRGNGSTMYRPRDSLHSVRSGQSSEHQKPMALPGVPAFGGLSPGFSNNQATSPLQAYPGHQHSHVLNSPQSHLSTSNHGAIPEQQAYRISRERQMQQRMLHHQHQQHPMSSPSSSQPVPLPSLTTSPPVTHVDPVPHQQHKNVQGLGRSAQNGPSGAINQGGKQRQGQAQQYQQSGRQHPQHRQQSHSQPTSKLMKGTERGNMVIHHTLTNDTSHLNGLSLANSASQVAEEVYSGSTLDTLPPSKPLIPHSTKPVQQISSHLEGVNQVKVLGSNQGPSSTVVLSRNRQQLQGKPTLKMVTQSQASLQRISQQNRQMNSDSLTKSQVDHSLTEHKSSSIGPPLACVDSAGNVGERSRTSVCDSSMTSESPVVGPSTSQGVTNSLGIEPFSLGSQGLVVEKQPSGSNLISHELEAQWQQQESQLLQKQSQIQGGLT